MGGWETFEGKTLLWTKDSEHHDEYVLRSGDESLGTLHVQKAHATATMGDDTWLIEREGFFRPRLVVRRKEGDEPIARLEVGALGSGRLSVAGERHYKWVQRGLLAGKWAFEGADGKDVVDFTLDTKVSGTRGTVSLAAGAGGKEDTPLLVALGWYVLTLYADDAVSVGL